MSATGRVPSGKLCHEFTVTRACLLPEALRPFPASAGADVLAIAERRIWPAVKSVCVCVCVCGVCVCVCVGVVCVCVCGGVWGGGLSG